MPNVQSQPICIFSDFHFMAWKDTDAPVDWVPQLVDAVQDAASLMPRHCVINGDLTNGKDRDYRLAMRHLDQNLSVPIDFTMGNHEYYGYYEDENYSFALAQQRFLTHTRMETVYRCVELPNCTMIFLSPEAYYPDEHGDAAWLSETQLTWFDNTISLARPDIPILVFLHQPIDDTVANSTGYCVQSQQVRSILRKRPGSVLVSGHTHCRMDRSDQIVVQDDTLFVGGGCVCNDFPQSRWLTIDEDRIRLDLRDHKSHQWITDYHHEFPLVRGRILL